MEEQYKPKTDRNDIKLFQTHLNEKSKGTFCMGHIFKKWRAVIDGAELD